MYVRKFEADSLDEALKNIKVELGPDAIILKTVTNNGIKGAFKKKKIEITAAISEKNYTKKSRVDNVLNDEQKDSFYSNNASYISSKIESHDVSNTKATSYGNLGLNKAVSSTKNVASTVKSALDNFLGGDSQVEEVASESKFTPEQLGTSGINFESDMVEVPDFKMQSPSIQPEAVSIENNEKVDELEKKLFELTKQVSRLERSEPLGVYQLRTSLRSLDINERYIQELIKKSLFEINEKDLENADIVFEFALREMINIINVEMPLFSRADTSIKPVVTILVSDVASGQSSTLLKLGAMNKNSVLISYGRGKRSDFSEKLLGIEINYVNTIAEIVSEVRKSVEAGKKVFVDYKDLNSEINETKKFVSGIKRSFDDVEVLLSLSAIHTEIYNKKEIRSYRDIVDGLIVSHLDLCLNFGMLFNISEEVRTLPYVFFGTGSTIPSDIESATAERILAGIFDLE
jgi:flagellar biosynthesis protein FlhF